MSITLQRYPDMARHPEPCAHPNRAQHAGACSAMRTVLAG